MSCTSNSIIDKSQPNPQPMTPKSDNSSARQPQVGATAASRADRVPRARKVYKHTSEPRPQTGITPRSPPNPASRSVPAPRLTANVPPSRARRRLQRRKMSLLGQANASRRSARLRVGTAEARRQARSATSTMKPNRLAAATRGGATKYNAYGELAKYEAAASGSTVFSETVDTTADPRDQLGRIVTRAEVNGPSSLTFDYTYDSRGRLTAVSVNGSPSESYVYDANSNRTSFTSGGSTVTGTYDAQDRLLTYGTLSYTYTANGELRTKTDSATSEVTTYTYDVRGNLVRVDLPGGDVIEYLVDGQARRVGKKRNGVLEKQWLYKDSLNIVAELNGSGSLVSRFVYASKPNVPAFMVRGGTTYRIISDHLGSPRAIVNVSTGAVTWRANFDAWGNRTLITGAGDFMPFGFAGGQFDGDTGLTRFGARDYDPGVGRWTSKDPIRFEGGVNLFGYAELDPVNLIDIDGRQAAPPVPWWWIPAGAAAANPATVGPLLMCVAASFLLTGDSARDEEEDEPSEICRLEYELGNKCVYMCPSGTVIETLRHGLGPNANPANDVCPQRIIHL